MSELLESMAEVEMSWRKRLTAAVGRVLALTASRGVGSPRTAEAARWAEIERASLRLPAAKASAIRLLCACGNPGAELLEVQRAPADGGEPSQSLQPGWLVWRDPWFDGRQVFRERTLYLLDDGSLYIEHTTDGAVQYAAVVQEDVLRCEYRDDLPAIVDSLASLEADIRITFGAGAD